MLEFLILRIGDKRGTGRVLKRVQASDPVHAFTVAGRCIQKASKRVVAVEAGTPAAEALMSYICEPSSETYQPVEVSDEDDEAVAC